MDRIAIRNRPGEPLQEHHARSFSTDEAIGRRVKRFAPALRRQHRSLRKADESAGCYNHSDATRQSGVAAPGPNVFTRCMHRGQRGRTRGVHRDAWPTQIEAVGDAVGGNAVSAAGRRVWTNAGVLPWGTLNPLIFIVRYSNKHSEIGPSIKIEHDARVLYRLPSCLQ